MSEQIKIAIGLIVTLIGVPTAILGFIKAYIELKRIIVKKKNNAEEPPMNHVEHSTGSITDATVGENITNTTNTHATTINGDVSIEVRTDEIGESADNNIILKERYTSIFAENGRLHNERIIIKILVMEN